MVIDTSRQAGGTKPAQRVMRKASVASGGIEHRHARTNLRLRSSGSSAMAAARGKAVSHMVICRTKTAAQISRDSTQLCITSVRFFKQDRRQSVIRSRAALSVTTQEADFTKKLEKTRGSRTSVASSLGTALTGAIGRRLDQDLRGARRARSLRALPMCAAHVAAHRLTIAARDAAPLPSTAVAPLHADRAHVAVLEQSPVVRRAHTAGVHGATAIMDRAPARRHA